MLRTAGERYGAAQPPQSMQTPRPDKSAMSSSPRIGGGAPAAPGGGLNGTKLDRGPPPRAGPPSSGKLGAAE